MKIANIYPVKNQGMYYHEDMVMILAHLQKQHLYDAKCFREHQWIIMDNGLYEEAQVSTSLQEIVDMADNAEFKINELIIPDVLNDLEANIKMFEDNLITVKKYDYRYMFMFVAQSKTVEELDEAIKYINKYYGDVNLSVGISKLCPFDRAAPETIEVLKKCKFPIHFLGIKTTFKELLPVKDIIRSCDTSQIVYIAKNEDKMPESVIDYERKGRREDGRGIEGVDVDLEHDDIKPLLVLKEIKEKLDDELKRI